MDGMTVLKERHRIYYRDNHEEKLKRQNLTLRNFYQIGYGALPYEYWLDEAHHLIMMISSNRIYILDDNAENLLKKNIESLRSGGGYYGYPA